MKVATNGLMLNIILTFLGVLTLCGGQYASPRTSTFGAKFYEMNREWQ
jgi:hypothetical protein